MDDHRLFADAVSAALRRARYEVLEPVTTATEAVTAARRQQPDIALVDIGLPDASGVRAGTRILKVSPRTKVIAVTAIDDADVSEEVVRAGFHGHLLKDVKLTELVDAIEQVLRGEVVPPSEGRRTNLEASSSRPGAMSIGPDLTRRELQVLELLARGVRGREIARTLGIRPNTVRTHVQNILTKLQVHSRLEAASIAAREGLLSSARLRG